MATLPHVKAQMKRQLKLAEYLAPTKKNNSVFLGKWSTVYHVLKG